METFCFYSKCDQWLTDVFLCSCRNLEFKSHHLMKVIVNFLYQIKFRMCQNRIEFWIKTVHNLYINNTWCKIGIIFMVLFLFEFLIRVWQKIFSSSNTKVSQRRSNYLSINENLFVNQIMMVFVCYINSHYNTFH